MITETQSIHSMRIPVAQAEGKSLVPPESHGKVGSMGSNDPNKMA